MNEVEKKSRAYWHKVLTSGGKTAVPQWTLSPEPGVDEHVAAIPEPLMTGLRQLADHLGISLTSILLAAHAKVLSTLSGEQMAAIGYVADPDGRPLPCRISTGSNIWRALLLETHQVETTLLSHQAFPVHMLMDELQLTEVPFESEFAPAITPAVGGAAKNRQLTEGSVLQVGFATDTDQLLLRYRTDRINADCAARLAGYHLTALTLITADLDADHQAQSLLSAEERHFLIEGLAGPKRELPDLRFHQIFEQRVNAHPDTIAAIHGDEQWSYRELNSRANQIGHALLAQGLNRESVVAVVTERNLDWMAAVIAIFKAGGVYLPIEPHFPADRIANMLSRAECKLVLTEPESTTTLKEALNSLNGVKVHLIDTLYENGFAENNLAISVTPDQLAYIYFTSGSTGEPKGAMCEQGGMLNHLYAKIDDLQIGEGEVVSQVAPQCFDISLWQLVSALLVGGRTVIISQDVILDVEQFIQTITEERVGVMQVVPSYLEVVLSYLDQHNRELPDLNCVSVTGEALTMELAQRWFKLNPTIKLVNAYGLTETSDDTNHEVMQQPPAGDRVPLGPATNNVYIYIVDEDLSPVPLGAPGEIVFSGICVGRGYINDPERTRLAFMDDPIRSGERIYRSGDFGRWQPDGKLEFLGRRDAQVKIRGFRIEIGDIENALLQLTDIRLGAVVVAERDDKRKYLVAFYTGRQPLKPNVIQEQLGQTLPAYMVPSTFYWQESLPLTDNGKINRKRLRVLAAELDNMADKPLETENQPSTPTERRLAAAWSKVLSIPEDQFGRQDHFFDRGGTSLSAVRLAIAMDRTVSLKDVTRHPVLADLASLVDGRSEQSSKQSQELMQSLAEPEGTPTGTRICFPYAGGNAVNFQPIASKLVSTRQAIYAVELPGHDLGIKSEPFAPIAQVADQIVSEIIQRGLRQVQLWGHSSGAALTIETAKKLHDHGIDVQRIFIGAQLLGEAAERRAAISALSTRSNKDIATELSERGGYTELRELDERHAEHIGAAYRHDCISAHHYFVDALENPSPEKLPVPITVVAAADDPSTVEAERKYERWQLLSDQVDLYELVDGGHYFPRTRPAETAQIIKSVVEAVPA